MKQYIMILIYLILEFQEAAKVKTIKYLIFNKKGELELKRILFSTITSITKFNGNYT